MNLDPVKMEQPAAAEVLDEQALALSELQDDRLQVQNGARVWTRAVSSGSATCG